MMSFLEFLIEWATIIGACGVVVITVAGIVLAVKYYKS